MGYQIAALKLIIIVPNIIFFCMGCIMIGSTADMLINHMPNVMWEHSEAFKALSGATIAAGVILCIVSFLAVCGALADKRKMLKAYAIILCVVILLEITAAILAFVVAPNAIEDELKVEVKDEFKDVMSDISNYTWYYGMGLTIMVCIEIILALSACFLSSKIKGDRVWEF